MPGVRHTYIPMPHQARPWRHTRYMPVATPGKHTKPPCPALLLTLANLSLLAIGLLAYVVAVLR